MYNVKAVGYEYILGMTWVMKKDAFVRVATWYGIQTLQRVRTLTEQKNLKLTGGSYERR